MPLLHFMWKICNICLNTHNIDISYIYYKTVMKMELTQMYVYFKGHESH